jgi:zinc protease
VEAPVTENPTTVRDIMPFEALERELPNGLRVIVVNTGFPNLVSLQIPVRTGSRNEVEPGKSGFAHFFEHMMFRGTAQYPPEKYQDIITRAGARQNAYTTDDYTNYHITFAREDLAQIIEIEADRFMHLAYSEEGFKTEARAVLGEYNKNSADPLQKLFEVQREHAFDVHTYKHTTMGFIADIENMPNQFDYSKTFFERWYRPRQATILVAGDVDPEETFRLVEKHWGGWAAGDSAEVAIPQEPPHRVPVVAHVPWPTTTLPWVTVAFHAPAFSTTDRGCAALDTLLDLTFGETSELYQRLVEREQVADQFAPYYPTNQDPSLATIFARVKKLDDVAYVRDAILREAARSRREPVDTERLEAAKSHNRYAFARTLDNSESIASALARFVRYERRYQTLNEFFRVYDSLTVEDLSTAAETYFTDGNLVVTTLSHEKLPEALAELPSLAAFEVASEPAASATIPSLVLRSPSELLRFKLLFGVGSAHDPHGKEGLAALAAAMVTDAGSARLRIDEINRELFPVAGSFSAQVDREVTVLTGVVHRDRLDEFAAIVLPQLLEPGFRDDDFARLKAQHLNGLVQDLRANNDEELGKERLQANLFEGTPYGHPTIGTVAGIESITLQDVRDFVVHAYTRANLKLGATGDFPETFLERLQAECRKLPEGWKFVLGPIEGRWPDGMEVEIIQKETRATAISLGHPITVTRSHPDFAALWLARAYLGEHRASNGRLYQRIREVRGMNYGDYAYVEAFPRGMYQFFPDANVARRAQAFEIWIRPVRPEQAVFALKAAVHELDALISDGISAQDFEDTRQYLAKNVFVMTKTQDQQLGYALDSQWYGIGEYTAYMRDQLAALTRERVNDAMRRHLSARDISVVMITQDADGLQRELLSSEASTIAYDAPKDAELLAEDQVIGARNLGLTRDRIRITPADTVFAR